MHKINVQDELVKISKNDVNIFVIFLLSTIIVTYSSIGMILKYQSGKNAIALKVKNNNICHSNLNNIIVNAINVHRFSLNLIYTRSNERMQYLKSNIMSTRDSLKESLMLLQKNDDIDLYLKTNIIGAGYKYLGINSGFLKLIEGKAEVDLLDTYNIKNMRPCIEN